MRPASVAQSIQRCGLPSCKRGEREALSRVALAHHLRELDGAESLADRAQPAARLNRRELPGVADRDDLRADHGGVREQPLALPRRRHPRLVENDDAAIRQRLAVGDRQEAAVECPRRNPGLLGELPGGSCGWRDADHRVAGFLVDLAQHTSGVRLAGSGECLDDVDAVARADDALHGLA